MTIKLYDLAGADPNLRFSPFCWRIRMALAHKDLPVETIPWRFTEKDVLAFSGQGKVPVLVDGETVISDSWDIALYLDEAYANRPSLFGGPDAEGITLFVKDWCETVLMPNVFRLVALDLFAAIHPDDQAYFRKTREARFGTSLEALAGDPEAQLKALNSALKPLRTTLNKQPFMAGAAPNFADFIVFGLFQWARVVSPKTLLQPDDPVYAWRERLLDAYDGLARTAKGHPV